MSSSGGGLDFAPLRICWPRWPLYWLRMLSIIAVSAALWALWIWLSGQEILHLPGMYVASPDALHPLLVSAVATALQAALRPRANTTLSVIAAAVSTLVFGVAMLWQANIAGAADPYGYISQAALWLQGHLVIHEPIIRQVPWPDAAWTFSPLGYRPSATVPDAVVPTYFAGLPLMMALFQLALGSWGVYLVVPLCAALAIGLTFVLGKRLFDARVGLWGAILLATSPAFIFQSMWPMTDVPLAATWTAAVLLVVSGQPLLAGLAMALTLAIKPNLLPLPLAMLVWAVVRDFWQQHSQGRWRYTLLLAIGLLPAMAGVALLNWRLYGSPFASGYGNPRDMYALAYGPVNAVLFMSWLVESQTPAVLLALVFFLAPRWYAASAVAFPRLLLGGTIAAAVGAYLFYLPFADWWYLRFLLPMWPVLMLLTAAAIDALARRWIPRHYLAVTAMCVLLLACNGVSFMREKGLMEMGYHNRRYVDVARFVARHTEPRAVIVSMQQSGSIRYYAGRLTMRYDCLPADWLDRALEYLQASGRHPYIVLEDFEIDLFKKRFAHSNRFGRLNWPPMAVLHAHYVVMFDPYQTTPGAAEIPTLSMLQKSGWPCEPPSATPPPLQ